MPVKSTALQKAAEDMKTNKGTCESLGENMDLLQLWVPLISLPLSFQVLLTLDDDLDVVRRDQIPVF